MTLPNAEFAIIDSDKLISYCLNPDHFTGKHKARVFESVLGINAEIYYVLENAIKNGIKGNDAIFTKKSQFGEQFIVDIPVKYLKNNAVIRTAWIIKKDEEYPRLTTCYIL